MKKTFSVLFSFCIVLICAQVKFEKGYIINSSDVKKEVLIKNQGWVSTPDNFVYKTDENSAENIGTPTSIKEFGIYNEVKFISYNGDIDYSSDHLDDLSNSKEPELKNGIVFLKEVVNGKKNLYFYQKQNFERYFYSDSDSSIHPLTYKKYYFNGSSSQVATNDDYINQLKTIFSDDTNAHALAAKTKYTTNDLKKIFSLYNSKFSGTVSSNEQSFTETKKKAKFNLSVRPGLNFYSPLKIEQTYNNEGFPSKMGVRIGVEAEIVLPFNKNKWSIVLEPTYSLYNNKSVIKTNDNLYNMHMENYSFFSLPLSLRHYMFINNDSKIFINAGINILSFKTSSSESVDVDYDGTVFDKLQLSSSQNFKSAVFGIGFNYKNKYSVEARYNTSTNLLDEKRNSATADLKYVSLILGYNIF